VDVLLDLQKNFVSLDQNHEGAGKCYGLAALRELTEARIEEIGGGILLSNLPWKRGRSGYGRDS